MVEWLWFRPEVRPGSGQFNGCRGWKTLLIQVISCAFIDGEYLKTGVCTLPVQYILIILVRLLFLFVFLIQRNKQKNANDRPKHFMID